MNGRFMKLRLLYFTLISIFICGFGCVVKADDSINVKSVIWNKDVNSNSWNYNTAVYAKFIVTHGGEDTIAFCLDAPLSNPSVGDTLITPASGQNPLSELQKRKVINILLAAGYPNFDLKYNDGTKMSDNDAFFVTQAAVWYARYGENGTDKVFIKSFHKKMLGETQGFNLEKYSNAYKALVKVADDTVLTDSSNEIVSVTGSNGMGMEDTTINGNRVLLSKSSFSVNGADNYTVETSSQDSYIVSTDGSQRYDSSKVFSKNEQFKVLIDIADDSTSQDEISATFTVRQSFDSTNSVDYDLNYYVKAGSTGIQTLSILIPKEKTPGTASGTVRGNIELHEYDIPFAKVDTNGNKLGNANLGVYSKSNDSLIETIHTEEDESSTLKLQPGEYYLKEISSAPGYKFVDSRVDFTVDGSGKALVDGNEVNLVSITNEELYFSIKKNNSEHQALAGATYVVYNSDGGNYICGKTNSQGYLTESSSACNGDMSQYGTTNILNNTGVYSFNDLNYSGFQSSEVIIVNELEAPTGYSLDKAYYNIMSYNRSFDGYFAGKQGSAVNPITLNNLPVLEFNFDDYKYLNISKVSTTGGAEIPGAKLNIIKTEDVGKADSDRLYVDSWISTNEPHTFSGIIPGVKYRLTEEVAPSGFIKMVNSIDFIMDENGNVTTYDIETGNQITDLNGSGYSLLITNAPTKTLFSKTSAVTGEEIPGAKLKVCTEASYNSAKSSTGDGNNCQAYVNTYTNKSVAWESEAGKTHIEEALPVGKYYLVEEIAPEGYIKQVNSAGFEVKTDGSITKVELKNEPTKLYISKKDISTEGEIPGAELKICTLDAYNTDGSECVPSKSEWSFVSGNEPTYIEALPFGEYLLIETLPASNYDKEMIVNGELMSVYKFSISPENHDVKIDVYNRLLTDVPNTGISTLNLFAIGGLMIFTGYEIINIYRKRTLVS